MKLANALLFLSPLVASSHKPFDDETHVGIHHPHRISYNALLDEETFKKSGQSVSFFDALSEYGIISIKDISGGYEDSKKSTLMSLHGCARDSAATQEHHFNDGTVRLTMATHTVPGPGGQQEIRHNISPDGSSESSQSVCSMFSESSDDMRLHVYQAVVAFSARLGSFLNTSGVPLLSTNDNEYDFDTFEDVVKYGEHLEHFHSYQSLASDSKSVDTIEMHTDQGVFIAFVPALMVDTTSAAERRSNKSHNDFYIELKDGSRAVVDLDENDLVIMLGDGVNQFINPKLKASGVVLRATPHALDMRSHKNKDEARVWYGRMVLPPAEASHPEYPEETFGDMRQRMIDASLSSSEEGEEILGLGCSGTGVAARQLEETVCAAGSMYCWHRCMAYEDYGISEDICGERELEVKCVNPRDQVYTGGHGDYYPACSISTEPASEYPSLDSYPPDAEICDSEAWEEFSSSEGYDYVFDKLGDNRGKRDLKWEGAMDKGGNVTKFMWNVDGDMIEGKIVFNGMFGYLAFGFQKMGGRHNGMNGASIIMAMPGGDYSAKFGIDLSMNDTVQEYVIHPTGSAFRHWSDPLPDRDVSGYDVISTECFTAMTFKTDSINDIMFNVSGTDNMLWSGNNRDYFMGYHGRGLPGQGDRDRFVVEWSTGKAWFPIEEEEVGTLAASSSSEMNGSPEKQASSSSAGMNSLMGLVTMGIGTVVFGMV